MGAGAPGTRGRPWLREQTVQSPGIKPRPCGVRAPWLRARPGRGAHGQEQPPHPLSPTPIPRGSLRVGLPPVGGASLVALTCPVSIALGTAPELSPSSRLPSRSRTSRVGLLVCREPRLTPAFGRPQLPAAPTLGPAARGRWAAGRVKGSQRQLSGQTEGLPLIHLQPLPAACGRPPGEAWSRGVYRWTPGPKGASTPVSTGCRRKFVSRCKYVARLPAGACAPIAEIQQPKSLS